MSLQTVLPMFASKVKFYRPEMNKSKLIGDACSWIEAHNAAVTLIEEFCFLFFSQSILSHRFRSVYFEVPGGVCGLFKHLMPLCLCPSVIKQRKIVLILLLARH